MRTDPENRKPQEMTFLVKVAPHEPKEGKELTLPARHPDKILAAPIAPEKGQREPGLVHGRDASPGCNMMIPVWDLRGNRPGQD